MQVDFKFKVATAIGVYIHSLNEIFTSSKRQINFAPTYIILEVEHIFFILINQVAKFVFRILAIFSDPERNAINRSVFSSFYTIVYGVCYYLLIFRHAYFREFAYFCTQNFQVFNLFNREFEFLLLDFYLFDSRTRTMMF